MDSKLQAGWNSVDWLHQTDYSAFHCFWLQHCSPESGSLDIKWRESSQAGLSLGSAVVGIASVLHQNMRPSVCLVPSNTYGLFTLGWRSGPDDQWGPDRPCLALYAKQGIAKKDSQIVRLPSVNIQHKASQCLVWSCQNDLPSNLPRPRTVHYLHNRENNVTNQSQWVTW